MQAREESNIQSRRERESKPTRFCTKMRGLFHAILLTMQANNASKTTMIARSTSIGLPPDIEPFRSIVGLGAITP